ncbi:hypothetical protein N7450_010965 [Penicillium hetheringtonii]|uniref:DUF1308 domain-containing protein n=1 Tax=Penicillium hetheringtonii TaxID=911720 RepID=A0AAD6D916_9EURO|nr:hypothetical protein N7450_010965 [Penicillium hetheringtonii]
MVDVNPPPGQSQTPPHQEPSGKASAELHEKCLKLLGEIDELQSLLNKTLRNPQLVEVRQFRSNVNSEFRMLQRLEEQMRASNDSTGSELTSDAENKFLHALRSSNLPFYQAVWNIARGSCSGLVAMGKRFYWDRAALPLEDKIKQKGEGSWEKKRPGKNKSKGVFVDIVADDGDEWVKVSTISESRVLFDMAKKGWEKDSEDEFSDEDGEGPRKRTVLRNFNGEHSNEDSDDDDDELELIKLARDLRKAADATRVRYKHPRLRIVLPKIEEGSVDEIDDVLKEMRGYGIKVECQNSQPASTTQPELARLLPSLSDLSHFKDIPILPHFHRAIVRQIEVEKEQPLLPTELWLAMGNRELICTKEAAKRMCEIVNTIGTETEIQRMELVMGNASTAQLDHKSIIEKFQSLSDWQVPIDWALPVKIVDAHPAIDAAKTEKKTPPGG